MIASAQRDEAAGVRVVDVLVIGGGQAGLAAAQRLQRDGTHVAVIDAAPDAGHAWRQRWDTLRLFTPASFSRLPGADLHSADATHPSKDEVAEHLASIADQLDRRVHHGVRATALHRDAHLQVSSDTGAWRARLLVVATGAHHRAHVPAFASELPSAMVQLHARDYRRPSDLPDGPVVVVGAGNSGAEIALDLAASGRRVSLAGRDVGHLPHLGPRTFQVLQLLGRPGAVLFQRRRGRGGDPLGRVRPGELETAGVERLPRVTGASPQGLHFTDGTTAMSKAVVWATGYRPDFAWLGEELLDQASWPLHRGGISTVDPRIGFVGLPLQRSIASHLLGGVDADAAHVARRLLARLR